MIDMLHGLRVAITVLVEQFHALRAQQDAIRTEIAELHSLINNRLSVNLRMHGSESESAESEFRIVEEQDAP